MRLCVLLIAGALVAVTASIDPCKRQPFRGRCPSQNGEAPKRSQFVLRYYLRSGECVSYPYGHCATDPTEPTLYRYKEECEDACISNGPANLGVPKSTTEDYQKNLLTKEIKKSGIYRTPGAEQSSDTAPIQHVFTLPVTTTESTSTTTVTQQSPELDSQSFEFRELQEQAELEHTSSSAGTPLTEAPEQADEGQPFNFNEHDLGGFGSPSETASSPVEETTTSTETTPITTTTTSEAVTTTPTTTSEAATTTPTTTSEAATTSTTEEVTTTTATTTTRTTPSTTEEAVTTRTTTTEAPTTRSTERMTTPPTTTTTTTTTASTEPPTTRRQVSTTTSKTTPSTAAPTQTTTTEKDDVASTTAPTTTGPRTECERRRAFASTSSIRGGFVPVCTSSGDFERVQCETNGQQCFCVNPHGIEVPNSRTRDGTRPDCYRIQSSRTVTTKECVGSSLPGPCHGSFQRYFYNDDTQKCEKFVYSGCGGNGNNYESREACEDRCAPPPLGLPKCEIGEPLKTKIGVPVNCAKTDCPSGYRCSVVQHSSVCCPENNKAVGLQTSGARARRCSLPKERGPCDKYELRFYFNADLNECKYFFWGGCDGNQNNFERVEDCESACGVQKSGVTNRPNTEIRTTQGIRITPNGGKLSWVEAEEEEQQELVQTTTPLAHVAVTTTRRVTTPRPTAPTAPTTVQTTTRAARVQTTRVPTRAPLVVDEESEEEEEEVVEPEDSEDAREAPLHVQPPVSQQNTVLLGVNRCLHPRDPGNCRGQFVRWFFDDEKKNCDVFTYTGCQGNGNNFASKEECMAICHKPEPAQQLPATPDFTQVCSNDVDAGECNGVFERFAFDAETQNCRAFTYGGCGGNGNNFATMQECKSRCVTAPKKSSSASACDVDIDVGGCAGVFSRFAFDKTINACRSFTYGGCEGNANNFATIQECTSKCVNRRPVCPDPPACDTIRCQLVNDRSGCPFCSCPPVKQASPPGTIISATPPRGGNLPSCPQFDRSACRDPCMVFHNRQGCEECVCPTTAPTTAVSGLAQPPASSTSVETRQPAEVGPPGSRATEAAPPAPSSVNPPRQFAVNTLEEQQPKIVVDQLPSLPRTLAAQIEEKCLQPVEPGPCKNFADRWYFNVDDGTCHPFKYGGCAGNRNHFFTQKECEVHCARFLSAASPTSSAPPKHAKLSPTPSVSSASSSDSEEEQENQGASSPEALVAFPAPKIAARPHHHPRQFAAPIFKPDVQGYGSEKIDSYAPPTPNVNLVGLSPPVHPTYFSYNGQDQGQRRAFSAGPQTENRIDVNEQHLEPLGSSPRHQPRLRGHIDGRQHFVAPQNVVTSSSSSTGLPQTEFHQKTVTTGEQRLRPQETPRVSVTPSAPSASGVRTSEDAERLPESENPHNASKLPEVTPTALAAPQEPQRFISTTIGSSEKPQIIKEQSETGVSQGSQDKKRPVDLSPRSQSASASAPGPRPDLEILNKVLHGRQSSSKPLESQPSTAFPHRFVTTTTASPKHTKSSAWYQTTSTPWWLRSPAPPTASKKRPELKIEKLGKQLPQSPPRFNFDPSRYTFYNGDYFGPTIPGIRINQTALGRGVFVQGGSGTATEAQEAFEQFQQLSKGFQEQANKFLEQERKAGRAPKPGSFLIGSIKAPGGIHDNDDDDDELNERDDEFEQPHPHGRAHGVPIQPTVPLVVPTYSSPLPATVRGPLIGKIEGLEMIGSDRAIEPPAAAPPAVSTLIVPRRIQGFQITRPTTTTTTQSTTPTTISTTPTTTTNTVTEEPRRSLESSSQVSQVLGDSEDRRDPQDPLPVIKEVQEEQNSKSIQVVDLDKLILAPRAHVPSDEFDRDMQLGSGEGSGVNSEFEMSSEEDSTPRFQEALGEFSEVVTPSTSEQPSTAVSEGSLQSQESQKPSSSSEEVSTATTTTTAATTTTTTTTQSLKKIQIKPRGSTPTPTSSSTTVTVTTSTQPRDHDHHRLSTTSSAEIVTPSAGEGGVVSDFAFNSDEDVSEVNTENVETADPVKAAGSKTLELVKAVETVKQHKEVQENTKNVNFNLPEVHPTTTPFVPAAPVTQGTPQPHFEPKFDGRIVCAMPPDAGVCTSYTPRWFFNSQTGQCEQFAYGSCGGNANNFFDRNTCERKCMPHHIILAQVPDRCSYEKDAGNGRGYNVKWYFNMKNLRCEQFVFEGLGGNTNQFETLSECERICTPSGPKTPTLPPTVAPRAPEVPLAPKNAQLPLGAPGSQATQLPETTTTVIDSQEEYDDDEDEDPIILPEANEMPPLSELVPSNTFNVNGLIGENIDSRIAAAPRAIVPEQTVAPVVLQSSSVAPLSSLSTEAPQPPTAAAPVVPDVSQSVPVQTSTSSVSIQGPSVGVPRPEGSKVSIVNVEGLQLPESEGLLSSSPLPPPSTQSTQTPSETTPLPPSIAPHPPATAHAAKTVIATYKAEPVIGREHVPTANDGQPLVGASPKETVNYQTGQVNSKAAGIKSFVGSQDQKISVDLFNMGADGPSKSINGMAACPNGRTEIRYSDGRPVMCLPGKNQCPDKSSCYFNGIDFFCCPEEEDPYDKHAFGGYGGEETKNGYKVFGALNIRRLMDEVPLRLKRQAFGSPNSFNIDSVVAPLRFDDNKPHHVSRALRMKSSMAVPRHGANPLCIQPAVKGSCQEAHLRYYYDRSSDTCRLFEYSGCDGNANNFGSLSDCQRLCVLNVKNIKNGVIATTTAVPLATPEEDEKLPPGQCPGGYAPLGGASPVLCGNSSESIGCPSSYYCRRGPPDVCCPGSDPKLQQPEEIVKDVSRGVVKNESHMPRGFNRQVFLSTPKHMCPDAADPLILENGEPMLCGSGFDGVKMCPRGYYCAIDSARNSRLCCPLYGDAQRIASQGVFAPRLASNTETTTSPSEEPGDEEEDEDDDDQSEDFVAHLQMKPERPVNPIAQLARNSPALAADLASEGGVAIDLGNSGERLKMAEEEAEVTTTTERMMVQDKTVCQIKPSEGRVCNDSEKGTRTNLQYFYSPRDNRCKLFFFRGCGGNSNRFERKADCEALCL